MQDRSHREPGRAGPSTLAVLGQAPFETGAAFFVHWKELEASLVSGLLPLEFADPGHPHIDRQGLAVGQEEIELEPCIDDQVIVGLDLDASNADVLRGSGGFHVPERNR